MATSGHGIRTVGGVSAGTAALWLLMGPEWDAVVCGGGAAGLVLAAELAGPAAPFGRVLVVDDGSHPVDRRTWAFWARRDVVLDPAVVARWGRLRVHAGDGDRALPIAPYEYRLVHGEVLGSVVDRRAGAALTRLTGRVDDVVDAGTHGVAVVDGVGVTAWWVFDSRPPAPARPGEPRMSFAGCTVAAADDAFDPSTATFLDFRVRAAGVVRFGYVLPTSPRAALVDVVTLSTATPGGAGREDLDGYVHGVLGVSGTVRDHEAGEVPLREESRRAPRGRVVRVGRRAGLLRPATGFAVDRIARDAARIRWSLGRYGHPHARSSRRARHRWLDRVLLDVMAHDPDRIEAAFAALFARNPPARVLRFLDEDTSPAEEVALVATLPPWPFLRAARRVLLR